ncbi:MAG: ABC transporter permease [bacterium]|nr:ABC transporter permease [bacterium]
MLRNYLKIAFRNLLRQKTYSFINIFGLAVGMACCILILLWVVDELSFDRFHQRADHIYRLCTEMEIGGHMSTPVVSAPMAVALRDEFPEVANTARYYRRGSMSVRYKDKELKISPIACVDNSFFEIFSFPFLSGDPKTALQNANTVVLTEETARNLFGDENALGKILEISDGRSFAVTGVLKKIPRNSHLNFEMLYSFESLKQEMPQTLEAWWNFQFATYVLLKENTDPQALEKKFTAFVENHLGDVLAATGGKISLMLQPLTQIHLYSRFTHGSVDDGDILYVYIFSGIAAFILLIACINFINLTIARSTTRAKEVSVRKTFGAGKNKLIQQFLSESIVLSVIAATLAGILIEISLPLFNSLAGPSLSLNYFQKPEFLIGLFCLALIVES